MRRVSHGDGRVFAMFGREYIWGLEDGALVLIPYTWQFAKEARRARGIRPWFDQGPW